MRPKQALPPAFLGCSSRFSGSFSRGRTLALRYMGGSFRGVTILAFPKHVKMPLILAPVPVPIGQGASMGGYTKCAGGALGFLAREAVAFRIRSYSSVRIRKAISACYTVSRARKPYLPAILFLVRETQMLLITSPHSRLHNIVISTAGLLMFIICRSMA
ncbi:hypothetical protein LI328DRAFT_163458 [Trichoderma asperelloides]|nr:hypothetical protein LI328DRAFT_163458 [Trichoderma asperelloides]